MKLRPRIEKESVLKKKRAEKIQEKEIKRKIIKKKTIKQVAQQVPSFFNWLLIL